MAVVNALAYYYVATITAVKCFIVHAPSLQKLWNKAPAYKLKNFQSNQFKFKVMFNF